MRFAVEQTEGSIPLQEFALPDAGQLAVVFGNEVSGVARRRWRLCDGSVEIPQWGMKHSLNISVAAGIVLWELVRGPFEGTVEPGRGSSERGLKNGQ
jgi:23S rRNA (guanosine2251-2'-O)-methyltransferase